MEAAERSEVEYLQLSRNHKKMTKSEVKAADIAEQEKDLHWN